MSKRKGSKRRHRFLKHIRYRSRSRSPSPSSTRTRERESTTSVTNTADATCNRASLNRATCPGPQTTLSPPKQRVPFDQHILADIPDDRVIDMTKHKLDNTEPASQEHEETNVEAVKLGYDQNLHADVTAQTACLLFRLPLELREQIYDKVCERQTVCIDSSQRRTLIPGLLRTCKKLYNDTIETYYKRSVFYSGSPEHLIKWICSIPLHHISLLNTIRYDTFMQRSTTTMHGRGSRQHTIYHLNALSFALLDKGVALRLGVVEGNPTGGDGKIHWVRSDQLDGDKLKYRPLRGSLELSEP